MIEELLTEVGLSGSYQVHRAPLVLTIDERAHQVFLNFESNLDKLLSRRYPSVTPVWTSNGQSLAPTILSTYKPCDILIVPAMRQDHPGGLEGLVWVVDRLLGPGGCPWDIEQTHHSLKKYLLEESYELIQAIDQNDLEAMKEELGDVLLQPLMHTQIRQRDGDWGIQEVANAITDKLIRRHPHVFGDLSLEDTDQVLKNWDRIKKSEKGDESRSVLAGVPNAMPALLRAMEVSKRAARAGFEWPDFQSVWGKFEEETAEVKGALANMNPQEIRDEFGDLLFTVVNLARWAKVDAEDALRTMVDRFQTRFQHMESITDQNLADLSAEDWDNLWNQAKQLTEATQKGSA